MKIAYVINQYPQTSQSFIRREIAALETRGAVIHRFTVRRWGQTLVDPGDAAERDRTRAVLEGGKLTVLFRLFTATLSAIARSPRKFVQALRLALQLGGRSDRGRLVHLIYLAEACVLLRWIRDSGAEHIHAHFGTNSTAVAMLIHTLGGPPYSFTVHGPEEFDDPVALSLGEKVKRAAFVVAISEFGKSQLYRWADHQQWSKIHVIRCGLDNTFLNFVPPPQTNHRLVCIGRLVEQKGQLVLVEAAGLLKERGALFELVLIGDGLLRTVIESRIVTLGLESCVKLLGWRSNGEVMSSLRESRAMVLPSFAEGLPVVLMESLALGRPVVTTHVAGIPELVADGLCGYLVAPGNAGVLADAIQKMLSLDSAHLAAMGRFGAERVARLHNADIEAGKLLDSFANQVHGLSPARQPSAERQSPCASGLPTGQD